MGICYYCGKEVDEPYRCPHCNLTFCDEHKPQKAHKCIALNNQLSGVTQKPVEIKTIQTIESDEEPQHYRPRKRTKSKTGFLGQGVTTRKVVLVALTLAISLASILMLNQWQQQPDDPNVGPVFPTSPETAAHQDYVLFLINKARIEEDLDPLVLDTNSIAQRYAEEMLSSGEFKHNPELPSTMGENIEFFSNRNEINATEVLEALMFNLVYDDAENEWGNRDNILNEDYERASIGVAYDKNTLYLVQDFS